MAEAIIVAVITGGISLLGTVITVLSTNQRTISSMQKDMAVMNQRIDDLTKEVKEHNDFAKRMPVLEEKIKGIRERMSGLEDDRK